MRVTAVSVLMATLIASLVQAGHAQAIGPSFCHWVANGYRQNPNVKVPMRCVDNSLNTVYPAMATGSAAPAKADIDTILARSFSRS
jgi:hypothetical protein